MFFHDNLMLNTPKCRSFVLTHLAWGHMAQMKGNTCRPSPGVAVMRDTAINLINLFKY